MIYVDKPVSTGAPRRNESGTREYRVEFLAPTYAADPADIITAVHASIDELGAVTDRVWLLTQGYRLKYCSRRGIVAIERMTKIARDVGRHR